jgi:hypothetical protein
MSLRLFNFLNRPTGSHAALGWFEATVLRSRRAASNSRPRSGPARAAARPPRPGRHLGFRRRLYTWVTGRPRRRAASGAGSARTSRSCVGVHARPNGTSPRASRRAAAARILARVWGVWRVTPGFRRGLRAAGRRARERAAAAARRSGVHRAARPFARTSANHGSAPYPFRNSCVPAVVRRTASAFRQTETVFGVTPNP